MQDILFILSTGIVWLVVAFLLVLFVLFWLNLLSSFLRLMTLTFNKPKRKKKNITYSKLTLF